MQGKMLKLKILNKNKRHSSLKESNVVTNNKNTQNLHNYKYIYPFDSINANEISLITKQCDVLN